jgi:hypothetical protein
MSYDLAFYLNLDLKISNELGIYYHYTFSSFKGFKLIPLDELFTNSLDKLLVNKFEIFSFDFI